MASLDSVEHKIFRAAVHGKELIAELERYFQTNPCAIVREPSVSTDDLVFIFRAKEPIPTRFGLIIGDSLQNLRSSLDYLVWELVLAAKNQPSKKNMFPICMTPDGFKDAMRAGRLQGVDPRALAIIDLLQPYHLVENDRRKAPLLILDELTNINKHRHILLTAIRSHITTGMATVEMDGEVWAHSSALATNHGARFDLPIRAEEVPVNAQLVACLALNEGSAKNEEVTTLLNTLAKCVREVVKLFLPFLG